MSRGTKISLGGEERVLRYDLNALAEIGDRLDIQIRISHIYEDLLNRPMPLKAFRVVIWAGLVHENPNITEEEVGAMVDVDELPEVMGGFFGQLGLTSPDDEDLEMGQTEETLNQTVLQESEKRAT
jgi:hypothetical protein